MQQMKEAEEAQWTFLADTPRDQAEIGRICADLTAARHDAEILRETIRQARSRLEAYYSEVNASRMTIDRLMATCNIYTLFEEAKMIPYEAARQDVGGWEVEGFIKRLTRRDDTNSERLVLEAISYLRAFSCDCDALREANAAARQDAQRMRAELENVISLLEEAQSGYIPGCGGDMEWQRSRDVAIKDARAAIEESSDKGRT
jgi:outer membrane murein-binding lipoprotein Lpp